MTNLKSLGKTVSILHTSANYGTGIRKGRLIINADDWGRDRNTTQRINDCIERGSVSSVSAMLFMEDSARAAEVARVQQIDAGLHLNLTTHFTSKNVPLRLADQQQQLARYLKVNRFAKIFFNPLLRRQFEYVTAAQIDEYRRLYGADPERIDGHHDMHLCANVIFGQLLPPRTIVRRNFTFEPGERSFLNRSYRQFVDGLLRRRYRLTDYFFSLPPLEPPERLERIFSLACHSVVEVVTHPIIADEYHFLMGEDFSRLTAKVQISPG